MLKPDWVDMLCFNKQISFLRKVVYWLLMFTTIWGTWPKGVVSILKKSILHALRELIESLVKVFLSMATIMYIPVHLIIYLLMGMPFMWLLKIKAVNMALNKFMGIAEDEEGEE